MGVGEGEAEAEGGRGGLGAGEARAGAMAASSGSKAQVQLSGEGVESLKRVSEARREQDQLVDRINKLHGHLANAAAADGARAVGGVYGGGGERLRAAVDKYGDRLEALYADVLRFAEMERAAALAARSSLQALIPSGDARGAPQGEGNGAGGGAHSGAREGARDGPVPAGGRDAGGDAGGDEGEGRPREGKTRGEKRGRRSPAEPLSTPLGARGAGEEDAEAAGSSRRSGKKARRMSGASSLALAEGGEEEEEEDAAPMGGSGRWGRVKEEGSGGKRAAARGEAAPAKAEASGEGDGPVDRDGNFLPGAEVAVCLALPKKGEAVEFILCNVTRSVPPSSYEVVDTDFDEDASSKPRKHVVPRSRVLGLNYAIPSARQTELVLPAPPTFSHVKDSVVLALYPETSTMYKARVVALPHRKKRTPPFEYQVEFDDDEEPGVVGVPKRRVDAHYVVDLPPKFA